MSRKMMGVILALAMLFGLAGVAVAALSVHAGMSVEGDCAACHNNNPTPQIRGWGITNPGGSAGNWLSNTKIAPLCFCCHNSSSPIGGATAMENFAFHDNAHQFRATTSAPTRPDSAVSGAAVYEVYTGTGLPYTITAAVATDIECTSCHNVHNNDCIPFSMKGRGAIPSYDFSALCDTCHPGRVIQSVGVANSLIVPFVGANPYSTHPTDIAIVDIIDNGATNFEAIDVRLSRVTAVSPYVLGGKRTDGAAGGNMSCQTCHAVHGDSVTGYMPASAGTPLLAIANVDLRPSSLCEGCHSSPNGTLFTTVGIGTDHPMDTDTGWVFYPDEWAHGTEGVPISWQQAAAPPDLGTNHFDWGATTFNPTVVPGETPACSSCHDAHGGLPGTSLWYAPDEGPGTGVNSWCFSCHLVGGVIPDYHHSVQENLVTSQLGCGDCHDPDGGTPNNAGPRQGVWNAHNGFDAFRVALSATDSAFCEACHQELNPTAFVDGSIDSANKYVGWLDGTTNLNNLYPAHHGPATTTGADSHPVNTTSVLSNLLRYTGDWETDFAPNGPYDVVNADHPDGVFSEWGATSQVLCESCHNILENVGNRAASTSTLTGGYEMNILLLAYEDDGIGNLAGADEGNSKDSGPTGDALCRVCHNFDNAQDGTGDGAGGYVHYPAAHTVETSGFSYAAGETPYGRTTPSLLTSTAAACPEKSTADSNTADGSLYTAPGDFSYPDTNYVDCDSCHRAHNAWSDGTTGATGHLIVQSSWATNNPKTDPCSQCHDVDIMCGY